MSTADRETTIMDRLSLVAHELTAWMVLQRVNDGGVALLNGRYVRHGRPVPDYLTASPAELIETGQPALAEATQDSTEPQPGDIHRNGTGLVHATVHPAWAPPGFRFSNTEVSA